LRTGRGAGEERLPMTEQARDGRPEPILAQDVSSRLRGT